MIDDKKLCKRLQTCQKAEKDVELEGDIDKKLL